MKETEIVFAEKHLTQEEVHHKESIYVCSVQETETF